MAAKRDAKTVTIPQLDDSEPAAIPVSTRAHEEEAPKALSSLRPKSISRRRLAPFLRRTPEKLGASGCRRCDDHRRSRRSRIRNGLHAPRHQQEQRLQGALQRQRVLIRRAQLRWDAHDAGNLATIGFIGGGALAVGGFAMYLLGRPSTTLSARTSSGRVEASLTGDTRSFGGCDPGDLLVKDSHCPTGCLPLVLSADGLQRSAGYPGARSSRRALPAGPRSCTREGPAVAAGGQR